MTTLELKILRMCRKRPRHARSFSIAKPILEKLVADGLLERIRPEGGAARNMVAITSHGVDALEPA